MNIQIFGTKKCNDTKKAERFFKERGIKYQFVDMKEKCMSKGEFTLQTKDVYVDYRKSGYSKQFFEAHREEILLHKAAMEAFGQLDGRIPKVKDLNQEYAELLQKKKEAYSEYRTIKEENRELQMAKHNFERFLNQQEEEQKEKDKQHKKNEQSL